MENLFSTVDTDGQVTWHQGISKNSNDIHDNASKFSYHLWVEIEK